VVPAVVPELEGADLDASVGCHVKEKTPAAPASARDFST